MKYIALILFSIFLVGCGSASQKQSKNYVSLPRNLQYLPKCDQESMIESLKLKDLQGDSFQIFWSDHAAPSCPGALFPRMIINNPKVKKWIHVVVVDTSYQKQADFIYKGQRPYVGWMWQLINEDTPWVSLDILPKDRQEKSPYYIGTTSLFHDNPKWEPLPKNYPKETRTWTGYLYGLVDDKLENPIVALKWGFRQYRGKTIPEPIKPNPTDLKYWEIFKNQYNR